MKLEIGFISHKDISLAGHLNKLLRNLSQIHVNFGVARPSHNHRILPDQSFHINYCISFLLLVFKTIFTMIQYYVWNHLS